jgi:AcrR family transcriptional regulator
MLSAAVEAIRSRGFHQTRLADIAERVQTHPATVLHYFETKDALLAEALAFADERFYEELAVELGRTDGAREKLMLLVEWSSTPPSADVVGWPLWMEMWSLALHHPEVRETRERLDRRMRDLIASIVRDGQRDEEIGPADPDAFAIVLAALIDGLAIQVTLKDPAVPATLMKELCAKVIAAELDRPDHARPAERA